MPRRFLVIAAAACTSPGPAAPIAPPRPVAPAPPAFVATPVAYTAPIEARVRRYCPASGSAAPAPVASGKLKTYEFTAIAIDASAGYTATTQPRAKTARDPESIRAAFGRAMPRIGECLRVARTGGMRTRDLLDLFVDLEVDPFGAITIVTLDAPKELESCVRASLLAVRTARTTARITRASIRLDLSSIYRASALKVATAAPPAAPVRGHCVLGPDPLPVDEPTLAPIELDFDPPPPPRRSRPNACPRPDVDKLQIRRAVMAIHGDLRTCYLDALARQPDLDGTVTAHFVVGSLGDFLQLSVTGAGDDVLHACMTDALAATATASEPAGSIMVTMPFALSRSATGFDREAAAKAAVERARGATSADASCRARAALVSAYLGIDPAGTQPLAITDDPRVMTELESLSAFVAANPGPALAGCLDELAPTLEQIARWPIRNDEPARLLAARGSGLAEAIVRSERVAELFPHVERRLLLFIGDGHAMLDEHEAARDAYLRLLALGGEDRDLLERAADSYARVTRNRDDHLLWDDCPR